jgi:hypothetical protein
MGLRRTRALHLERSAVLGRCYHAGQRRNRRRWGWWPDGVLSGRCGCWADSDGRGPSVGWCWQEIAAGAESGHRQKENPTEAQKADFALWRVFIPPPCPWGRPKALRGRGRASSDAKSIFLWAALIPTLSGVSALTLFPVIIFALATHSQSELSKEDADKISQQINALMSDYTDTFVAASEGGNNAFGAPAGKAVVVVSLKVLDSIKVAKLWHFAAACTIAKHYNDTADAPVEEVWFTDPVDLAASPPRFAVLKFSVAKAVQSKLDNGSAEMEEEQAQVWDSLERKSIAKE